MPNRRTTYGIIHPDGVYAKAEVEFRVSSERVCKQKGLRVVSGKFDEPDHLECVRTNKKVAMKTIDNILVMETKGMADEIIDSTAFRSVVEEVRRDKISPLVDLTPFLPGHIQNGKRDMNEQIGQWPYFRSDSSLVTFLSLSLLVPLLTHLTRVSTMTSTLSLPTSGICRVSRSSTGKKIKEQLSGQRQRQL